jgi:hypothetical protein
MILSTVAFKRWFKTGLRTLHLLAVAGVGGGILFALEKPLWINYWWLALVSGSLMVLMDMLANRVWLVQVRGLTIILKLLLLGFLGSDPEWDRILLVVVIVISALISHAPGSVRYYSLYHRRVVRTGEDAKG